MADYKVPIITGTSLTTGDILRWDGNNWVNYADSVFQAQGAVLDNLNTLGAPASDGQFIVATGVGAFAYESTTTARTSLGIGEADTPTLNGLTIADDGYIGVVGATGITQWKTDEVVLDTCGLYISGPQGTEADYAAGTASLAVKCDGATGAFRATEFRMLALDHGVGELNVDSDRYIRFGAGAYLAEPDAGKTTGAHFQCFGNDTWALGGNLYFDAGSLDTAALIFRTAPTDTALIERMRITSGGDVRVAALTASRLLSSDGDKDLTSSDLVNWVTGTASQIAIADDTTGGVVLSLTGNMDEIAALTPTDGNIMVGNNTTWVAESGATVRTSLGLGTGDEPQFLGLSITQPSGNTAEINIGQSGVVGWYLKNDATSGNFRIFNGGIGTAIQVLKLTNDVGIGVVPNEKLEVAGKIRANTAFNHNGTDGITHSTAGAITTLTTAGGIVTAIARGGAAKFGDGGTSHYSEFEADGTLKFVGDATVFKDADVSVVSLLPVSGSEPGQFTFRDEAAGDTGIPTYSFSNDQAVTGSIEIPHDYKEGSNLVFHVHWQGTVAPTDTDNVQWQLTYTVGQTGATLDATATEVIETGFDTRYEFMRSDFPTITGTNYNIGDQFIFHLSRIAASANEYGGGARAATVGFHYECDTAGSRTIVAK